MSFWVNRDTELDWDYMFVEAHVPGSDEWVTLPDAQGHTSDGTGNSCLVFSHPFLDHYMTATDDACEPAGTSGTWNAATGSSGGYEQWTVDLSDYANGDVEVAIAYASDGNVQGNGVFVDDVTVSTGEGSTSFEDDGDTFDGWTVPGPPEGSPGNENDWIAGTTADRPLTRGQYAEASLDRQPEILGFLSGFFGPYPWSTSGGIVDDQEGLGFALETQTRPIYAPDFFTSKEESDAVVVHELAHQWTGDSLAVAAWQHIWLNEGFATYTEWLWSEREGLGSTQEIFDFYATVIPADDPFWQVVIGDPGTDLLFDISIYYRGAMTLQALRNQIGDDGVLPAGAPLGAPQRRRQRHHAAVHRARRADLRPGPRRLLRHVAVHAREARRDRARGPAQALWRRREGDAGGDQEGEEALGSRASIHASTSANTCACSGSWWISWNRPS